MATSPKFRQTHGLASFASLPTSPEDMKKAGGGNASEMEKMIGGTAGTTAPTGSSGRADKSAAGATGAMTDGSGRTVRGVDPKKLQIDGNIQRCGFSWDDAAAKCGPPCPMALQSECDINAPKVGVNSSWINHNYSCFAGLPPCDPAKPKGNCYSRKEAIMDQFCTQICNMAHGYR